MKIEREREREASFFQKEGNVFSDHHRTLPFYSSTRPSVDVASIVSDAAAASRLVAKGPRRKVEPRDNDPDFVDDVDVPPLA